MSNPFRYFNSSPEVIRLVNPERHLVTREIYKQRRSAALAEWRFVHSA